MSALLRHLATLPFEKISGRPSKTYFYSKFFRDVRENTDVKLAADIASARFDNAEAFESDYYLGVDLDDDRLTFGRERYSDDPTRIAIQADITNHIFQPGSIDAIACTHTLSHLEPNEHFPMVKRLVEYLSEGGCLFIQFSQNEFTDRIEPFLRNKFNSIEFTKYNNLLSKIFERHHMDNNGMINVNLDGWMRRSVQIS
jgi:SAM-dependent methyltransferase